MNGQPLEDGQISFVGRGENPGPASGAQIKEGRFYIPEEKGPLPGEYQVQIRAFKGTGKMVWDGMGDTTMAGFQKNMVEDMKQFIPPKYNAISDLKATLAAEQSNDVTFDLEIPELAKTE